MSAEAKVRLLLVQAHAGSAVGLMTTLEFEGYDVVLAEDGVAALELCDRMAPRVVLTDLALPVLDGFGMIRKLRASGSTVPVIVLTDRTDEADRVAALRLGADDFLSRPFSLLELFERIKIQLRKLRAVPHASDHAIRLGEMVVDSGTRTIRRGSSETQLRPKEFDVLSSLWRAAGAVVTKEQLLNEVWGFNCEVDTRRLDFQVTSLREKIEPDPSQPRHLLTVRGVGYRLLT